MNFLLWQRMIHLNRQQILSILVVLVLVTLACNIPVATGAQKMTPVHLTSSGDRTSFSGEYSCTAIDSVILVIDQNGIANLSTTGPVFVDHINCTLDPSGFQATYTISGIADPDSWLITFTSCNDGAYTAEGTMTYRDDKVIGHVSCTHSTGDQSGQLAVSIWVPLGNPSP
jgi:hypothetical protein